MCAGAAFRSGVGRGVFGSSTVKLLELSAARYGGRPLTVPCRGVPAGARPTVEVLGPVLQAEAPEAHKGYWT